MAKRVKNATVTVHLQGDASDTVTIENVTHYESDDTEIQFHTATTTTGFPWTSVQRYVVEEGH